MRNLHEATTPFVGNPRRVGWLGVDSWFPVIIGSSRIQMNPAIPQEDHVFILGREATPHDVPGNVRYDLPLCSPH